MSETATFHVVTVGTFPLLARSLWDRIAGKSGLRFSHIAHPRFDLAAWSAEGGGSNAHFLREDLRTPPPPPDREFLASLERRGVPTINNMILSDRYVSKLSEDAALGYATLLARRLETLYRSLQPSVVIGGFDALHGSLGFAVAKLLGIDWFVLNFSSLPSGQVALCADLSPASRVTLEPDRARTLTSEAEALLRKFETRDLHAAAYMPPRLFSPAFIVSQLPTQVRALSGSLRRRRLRQAYQYTDHPNFYSVRGLLHEATRLRKNTWRLRRAALLTAPGRGPYAFFGLHMQPESSIDVFAHFFSNQLSVIELMSRSLPPTHQLLVKLHKSDAPNYSPAYLSRLAAFPGVRLVSAHADTQALIRNADLVFSIQGTIGLEGALLGKPVIMFGDSPMKVFPSVSTIGRNADLPQLVRAKLAEPPPSRAGVIEAFANYLAPFYPASRNGWAEPPTESEIENYARLFGLLQQHLATAAPGREACRHD